MSIQVDIDRLIEPFTLAAKPNGANELWVRCDAFDTLTRQIERYAKGRISGQSFLLSGHRGSGKTTFAHLAVQQVRWASEGDPDGSGQDDYGAIPMLVPLHGPDFFSEASEQLETYENDLAKRALTQITRGLHRALCEEICDRFSQILGREDKELGIALRAELDQAPDLKTLRGYWDRAGCLGTGVLHGPRTKRLRLIRAASECDSGQTQGLRELLALHTAIDAVRMVAMPSEGTTPEPSLQQLVPTEHMKLPPVRIESAVQVAAPLFSLLAGAFAAHAVIETLGPISTGFVAMFTVLLTYSFLRRTGPPLPDRTLLSDTSSISLDILLPVLVERIVDAGLAPVFVVDELDKVDNLARKVDKLIKRLKYFVTDRALFCFVTDRDYFERLHLQLKQHVYPVEETYFADRLLVYFEPRDLHEYLNRALRPTVPAELEDDLSAGIAKHVILGKACAHLSDVRRIITLNTDKHGNLMVEDGPLWTVPGYRFAVVFEEAIEAIFEDLDVRRRLRQEPQFTHWVADALYEAVRMWRRDQPHFDLQKHGFEQALQNRISRSMALPASSLDMLDCAFLFEQIKMLCDYLTRPEKLFRVRFTAYREAQSSSSERLAVLLVLGQSLPLVLNPKFSNTELRCDWTFDQYGRPYEATRALGVFPLLEQWRDAVVHDDISLLLKNRFESIVRFEMFLSKLNTTTVEFLAPFNLIFRSDFSPIKNIRTFKGGFKDCASIQHLERLAELLDLDDVLRSRWRDIVMDLLLSRPPSQPDAPRNVVRADLGATPKPSKADECVRLWPDLKSLVLTSRFSSEAIGDIEEHVFGLSDSDPNATSV